MGNLFLFRRKLSLKTFLLGRKEDGKLVVHPLHIFHRQTTQFHGITFQVRFDYLELLR